MNNFFNALTAHLKAIFGLQSQDTLTRVDGVLRVFREAEQEAKQVQAAILQEQVEREQAIQEIEAKMAEADAAVDRLTRIQARMQEIVA